MSSERIVGSKALQPQHRVTVLMSVYNGADHLREAVESILGQTLTDLEFLVVDDGSTDTTPEILAGYTDPRLRVLRVPHGGLTLALNRGLAEAGGRYVARMDADDWSHPERLERQSRSLDADPQLGLVGCRVEVVDDTGTVLGILPQPTEDGAIKRRMLLENPFCHSAVMFRRSLATEVEGYDASLELAQDYDLWFRMAPRCTMQNLPETLHRWRLNRRSGISVTRLDLQDRTANRIRRRHLRRQLDEGSLTVSGLGELAAGRPGDGVVTPLFLDLAQTSGAAATSSPTDSSEEHTATSVRWRLLSFLQDRGDPIEHLEFLGQHYLVAGRNLMARLCLLEILRRVPDSSDVFERIEALPPATIPSIPAADVSDASVSVLVPYTETTRKEEFIERLGSLASQPLRGLEIVILESEEEGEGGALAGRLLSRVAGRVLRSSGTEERDWNRAIAEATGDWIAIMPPGFVYPAAYFETMLAAAPDGDIGLLYASLDRVSGTYTAEGWRSGQTRGRITRGFDRERLTEYNWLGTGNVMIRRGLLERIGGFRPDLLATSATWDVWLRGCATASALHVPRVRVEQRSDEAELSPPIEAERQLEQMLVGRYHAFAGGDLIVLEHLLATGRTEAARCVLEELKGRLSRCLCSAAATAGLADAAQRLGDDHTRELCDRWLLKRDPRAFLRLRFARLPVSRRPALATLAAGRLIRVAWQRLQRIGAARQNEPRRRFRRSVADRSGPRPSEDSVRH